MALNPNDPKYRYRLIDETPGSTGTEVPCIGSNIVDFNAALQVGNVIEVSLADGKSHSYLVSRVKHVKIQQDTGIALIGGCDIINPGSYMTAYIETIPNDH